MIHPKFGMPHYEVKLTKIFFQGEHRIGVLAGNYGWTIHYPNLSMDYENNRQSPEENLERAIAKLKERVPEAIERID